MSVKTVAVISEKRDEHVSGSRLAEEIQQACNELEADGYSISTVFPVTSGGSGFKNGVGYGYGYAYTSSVIIVAMKQI